jgi:hypothetical protein
VARCIDWSNGAWMVGGHFIRTLDEHDLRALRAGPGAP